jgi:hypothetical protein
LPGVVGVTLFEGCGLLLVVVLTGVEGLVVEGVELDGGQEAVTVAVAEADADADAEADELAVVPVAPAEAEAPAPEVLLASAEAAAALSDVGPLVPPVAVKEAWGGAEAQGDPMAVPEAAEAGSESIVPYTSEPSPRENANAAAARRLRRKTETPAEEAVGEASAVELF